VLGSIADDALTPADLAIEAGRGWLEAVLSPLASDSGTTIVGFTEITTEGHLYNAAAVYHRRAVLGTARMFAEDLVVVVLDVVQQTNIGRESAERSLP
jgi:hypothetical protein